MQILIFPPHSTTSSPLFPPSFPFFFPNFFRRNSLGNLSERLLKLQKNLPEKSLRKHFLPPLLPERGRETFPENPLFLSFLKGLGEEDKKGNPEKREEEPRDRQWLKIGLEERGRRTERGGGRRKPCGEEDTHKALIVTLF